MKIEGVREALDVLTDLGILDKWGDETYHVAAEERDRDVDTMLLYLGAMRASRSRSEVSGHAHHLADFLARYLASNHPAEEDAKGRLVASLWSKAYGLVAFTRDGGDAADQAIEKMLADVSVYLSRRGDDEEELDSVDLPPSRPLTAEDDEWWQRLEVRFLRAMDTAIAAGAVDPWHKGTADWCHKAFADVYAEHPGEERADQYHVSTLEDSLEERGVIVRPGGWLRRAEPRDSVVRSAHSRLHAALVSLGVISESDEDATKVHFGDDDHPAGVIEININENEARILADVLESVIGNRGEEAADGDG